MIVEIIIYLCFMYQSEALNSVMMQKIVDNWRYKNILQDQPLLKVLLAVSISDMDFLNPCILKLMPGILCLGRRGFVLLKNP